MRILATQPLRRQIFAVALALAVPFGALIAWSAQRARVERENELRDEAGSVAATASAYLTQFLSGVDSLALALSLHPGVINLQRDVADRLFAGVLRDQPLLLNIVLTDRTGTIKGSVLPTGASLNATVSLPSVMDVVAGGKPVVSDLVTGALSGRPTVIMEYPGLDGHRLVGVIGIGLDVSHIQTVFKDVPLPEGSVITLTDQQSRVLARSRDAERYIGKFSDAHPHLPRDVPRSQMLVGLDGIERFYGSAAVDRERFLTVSPPSCALIEQGASHGRD